MGDKKKYTGNIYLWAERKQGERPDKRQMEKERRQRNVAVGIVIIVEPGNPNTQRLYVSDKADEALEEKKKNLYVAGLKRKQKYADWGPHQKSSSS